jgi:hypothetical protein
MRLLRIAGYAAVALLSVSSAAFAQDDKSHWGAIVTFTPEWTVKDTFEGLFEASPNNMSGSEFQIGIARGRMQSGDWGVSLVKRRVKAGSTLGEGRVEDCNTSQFGNNVQGCFIEGELVTYNDDVTLTGFMVHKYVSFYTIKRRVQIGLNFAGGMGSYSGTATKTEWSSDFQFVPPNIQRIVERQPTTETVDAKTLFISERVPLGKLELAVAGIVAPGLKVRVGYGLDFPGYPVFSLSGIYLFGSD